MPNLGFVETFAAGVRVVARGETSAWTWIEAAVDGEDALNALLLECATKGIKVLVSHKSQDSESESGRVNSLPINVVSALRVLRHSNVAQGAHEASEVPKNHEENAAQAALGNHIVSAGAAGDVLYIDLSSLDKVIEYNRLDQVISVEAGLTLGKLQSILDENGQWFPVHGSADSTIHDIIASGDGGVFEHAFNGPRSLILGLQVSLVNGTSIKAGGKVVKNVTGYDMTKLMIGSGATLGVATTAHLRLFAKPKSSVSILITSNNPAELIEQSNRWMSSGLPICVLELVSTNRIANAVRATNTQRESILSNKWSLLCQIFEYDNVIAEVLPLLRGMLPNNIMSEVLTHDSTSLLLESVLPSSSNFVELNGSPSTFVALLNSFPELSENDLQIRPGAGRFRINCSDTTDLSALFEELRNWCSRTETSLYGAVRYGFFNISFSLPMAQEPALKIAKSIKDKFDPSGVLNPFCEVVG